jgi:hypothetical protein
MRLIRVKYGVLIRNCHVHTFFGIVNNTLRLVLVRVLDKKADVFLSQAWNAIAKK